MKNSDLHPRSNGNGAPDRGVTTPGKFGIKRYIAGEMEIRE